MSSNVRDKEGKVPPALNKKGTRGGVDYDITVPLFRTTADAIKKHGENDTLDMINAMLVTRAENEQAPTKEGSGSRAIGKLAKGALDSGVSKEEIEAAIKALAEKKAKTK